MENNDITQNALVMGDTVIPLGGDNVAVRITPGDRATVTRGLAKSIANRMVNPDAVLTVTCYKQDDTFTVCRALAKRIEALATAGARLPLPGSAQDPIDPWGWADAELVTAADGVLAEETETVSWTFALDSASRL